MQSAMTNRGVSGCTKTKRCPACCGDCDVDGDCASALKQAFLKVASFLPLHRLVITEGVLVVVILRFSRLADLQSGHAAL